MESQQAGKSCVIYVQHIIKSFKQRSCQKQQIIISPFEKKILFEVVIVRKNRFCQKTIHMSLQWD